jgi:hypothetical protein
LLQKSCNTIHIRWILQVGFGCRLFQVFVWKIITPNCNKISSESWDMNHWNTVKSYFLMHSFSFQRERVKEKNVWKTFGLKTDLTKVTSFFPRKVWELFSSWSSSPLNRCRINKRNKSDWRFSISFDKQNIRKINGNRPEHYFFLRTSLSFVFVNQNVNNKVEEFKLKTYNDLLNFLLD